MLEKIDFKSEKWLSLKELPNEIFKTLKVKKKGKTYNYKGLYEISNYGRVKSLGIYHGKTNNFFEKPHIMKGNINKHGYILYALCNHGETQYFTAHRIVATTFIYNPDNLLQVNHKDGNKLNNCVDNLEWCTASYNVKHAFDNGLKIAKGTSMPKEKNPNARYTEKEIEEIRRKRREGCKLKELAKEYKNHESYISEICNYKFWK